MRVGITIRSYWWLVVKDLMSEVRVRWTWAGMFLLGLILVLLLEMQLELSPDLKRRVVSSLLWLDIFFAGTLALDRAFAGEREDGCWRALALYPIPAGVVFLAKVTVTATALFLLECLLLPALVVFSDVPLLHHPLAMLLVAMLANLGFAAVGVVASALTTGVSRRGSVLAVLILPLTTPLLLGASETTHLLLSDGLNDAWWRWLQLLAGFAAVFIILGMLVFEVVLEE